MSLETQNGANLEAVAIVGTCSGDWSGSVNGLTDSTGVVVLQTPPIKNGSSWTFCIDSATTAFATFDPAGPDCGSNVGPSTFGEVAGVVTDSVTAAPIGGATVSADSGQSDTTDAGGKLHAEFRPDGYAGDHGLGGRLHNQSADSQRHGWRSHRCRFLADSVGQRRRRHHQRDGKPTRVAPS